MMDKVTQEITQGYAELITILHDYALEGESPTDTLSRLLTEREELRKAARMYIHAFENQASHVHYSATKSALGEALV
jgi:hypothetical protein